MCWGPLAGLGGLSTTSNLIYQILFVIGVFCKIRVVLVIAIVALNFQAGLITAPIRAVSAMKTMNIPQQIKDMKLPDLPQAIKDLKFWPITLASQFQNMELPSPILPPDARSLMDEPSFTKYTWLPPLWRELASHKVYCFMIFKSSHHFSSLGHYCSNTFVPRIVSYFPWKSLSNCSV